MRSLKTRQEIIKKIRQIAKEEGVDPDLAVKVAECESGLNPSAIRKNPNGTWDRGLYQWNDYYHPEISDECAYDIDCATRAFCKAVKKGHLNWWSSSKHCWKSAYKKSLISRIRAILKSLQILLSRLSDWLRSS